MALTLPNLRPAPQSAYAASAARATTTAAAADNAAQSKFPDALGKARRETRREESAGPAEEARKSSPGKKAEKSGGPKRSSRADSAEPTADAGPPDVEQAERRSTESTNESGGGDAADDVVSTDDSQPEDAPAAEDGAPDEAAAVAAEATAAAAAAAGAALPAVDTAPAETTGEDEADGAESADVTGANARNPAAVRAVGPQTEGDVDAETAEAAGAGVEGTETMAAAGETDTQAALSAIMDDEAETTEAPPVARPAAGAAPAPQGAAALGAPPEQGATNPDGQPGQHQGAGGGQPDSQSNPYAAAAAAGMVPDATREAGDHDRGDAAAVQSRLSGALDATQSLAATAAQSDGQRPVGETGGPASPAAAARPPEVRFAEANHGQIVTGVRGELLPNGGSMKIRLDPPQLGALQVTVHMRDGVMTASFETSSDEATKLLSHSLGQLKTALESQGVSVDRLHVQQGPREPQSSGGSGEDRQQQDQQRGSQQEQSARQEQQRKEMLRRMWQRLSGGRDPLDVTG